VIEKVCGMCHHWEQSLTLGNCNKGHGGKYGVEMCSFCDDFETPEQHRIRQLESKNLELRAALECLYNHTKNDHCICGLNAAARKALEGEVVE